MTHFAKNIAHLRKLKGLSQEAFAGELDITRSRVSSYEEGRSEPPFYLLVQVSDYFKLPIDAIVRHDLSKANNTTFLTIGSNKVLFPIQVNDANEDNIEVVPLKASAGYMEGYSDPEYISKLQTLRLPFLPSGKFRAFPIKGDSMLPVREGDFVVASHVESTSEIKNGKTYIVLTQNDGLVYKRVYTQDLGEGKMRLVSDNKEYQSYEIHLNDVLELWEFCLRLDFNARAPEELNINSIHQLLRSMKIDLEQVKQNTLS